jgi:hypothetical protein
VLKWDVFSFGFLQVLSRIPLVVLGDPQGCPRQECKLSSPLIAHDVGFHGCLEGGDRENGGFSRNSKFDTQ